MSTELLSGRVLDQPDEVAVFVFDGCDQSASPNVLDLLNCLCAGIHEQLQTFLDIVHVIIGRHSLLVTIGVQADILGA